MMSKKETNRLNLLRSISYVFLIAVSTLLFFSLTRCTERTFDTSSTSQLSFSTDTLSFDTIFTTIGSTTRYFKVFNPHDNFLKVENIRLAKGEKSYFRLNINGNKSNRIDKQEIAPRDSMYVFVEVTIDPNNENSPIIEKDSVIFETNGNQQDVKLIAYGQDVHIFEREVITSQHWTKEKPYLLLDTVVLEKNATLEIDAGTQIYFGSRSGLFVLGSVKAVGTKEDPVVFTSARTEKKYKNVPGLWNGLHFLVGSSDNYFENVHVKNAVIGLRVDSVINDNPTLQLHNSRVEHHTFAGLLGQGADILATNSIFADCGAFAVSLQVGGSYRFFHCTIANYWGYPNRNTPSLYIKNYYMDRNNNIQLRPIELAAFQNCIIEGNKENEVILDAHEDAEFLFGFDNCLVKSDPKLQYHELPQFNNCEFNVKTKIFADPTSYDYRLSENSPALNKGNTQIVSLFPELLQNDINQNDRTVNGKPDIGAHEFEPLEEEEE